MLLNMTVLNKQRCINYVPLSVFVEISQNVMICLSANMFSFFRLTEIGDHFRFDPHCIASVSESKFQFEMKVVRGDENLSDFQLSVACICHDSIGNQVFAK